DAAQFTHELNHISTRILKAARNQWLIPLEKRWNAAKPAVFAGARGGLSGLCRAPHKPFGTDNGALGGVWLQLSPKIASLRFIPFDSQPPEQARRQLRRRPQQAREFRPAADDLLQRDLRQHRR